MTLAIVFGLSPIMSDMQLPLCQQPLANLMQLIKRKSAYAYVPIFLLHLALWEFQ